MSYTLSFILILCVPLVKSFIIDTENANISNKDNVSTAFNGLDNYIPENIFNGVYTECFLRLSYSCLQEKTLLYLRELNKLSEVSVLGEYVKFVKINKTEDSRVIEDSLSDTADGPEEISIRIDKAIDNFFNGHILKFNAFGEDVAVPNAVEKFVGRKRKGGGGGGGGGGGHGGHGWDDGGKKKMMMMAMMCMKMKLMMMVPAMMGMMGMMSFKGMMFSMMSFMVSKMMLLMKILEKKGFGGVGDGGWAAGGGGGGGGGGGAWMPAGGQDYGGGGGGGYDANGQWQSRAIAGVIENGPIAEHDPIIAYIPPLVRTSHRRGDKFYSTIKNLNDNAVKTEGNNDSFKNKSRNKRGIVDVLQSAYLYWLNQIFGSKTQRTSPKYPKYKLINGVRYVYFPIRYVKKPKQLNPQSDVKPITPIVASEDFNKGEILDGSAEVVESRNLNVNKIKKLANDINDVIEQDPWE